MEATRSAAVASPGTRSATRPLAASAPVVAGPTAAIRTPPRERPSCSSGMKRSTALTDVKTIQSYSALRPAASSSARVSTGPVMAITGTTTTVAPASARPDTRSCTWGRGRVTTTDTPDRGRRPRPPRSRPATDPTTMVAGGRSSTAGNSPRRTLTERWAGAVPHSTTRTGVSGLRPPSIRRRAISALFSIPIKITSVPPARASASHATPPGADGSPTWPVTTVTDVDRPRWVTGTPA